MLATNKRPLCFETCITVVAATWLCFYFLVSPGEDNSFVALNSTSDRLEGELFVDEAVATMLNGIHVYPVSRQTSRYLRQSNHVIDNVVLLLPLPSLPNKASDATGNRKLKSYSGGSISQKLVVPFAREGFWRSRSGLIFGVGVLAIIIIPWLWMVKMWLENKIWNRDLNLDDDVSCSATELGYTSFVSDWDGDAFDRYDL